MNPGRTPGRWPAVGRGGRTAPRHTVDGPPPDGPPSGRGTPATPPATPGGRAARVLIGTPLSLSQQSPTSPPRSSPVHVAIGQAKARAPQKSLFEGDAPLVERKTATGGGGVRFKFTQTTPLERLRQPIAGACHELFARTQALDEAIAFLDAVCRQPGEAQVWHEMLRCHGEALCRSPQLLPTEVLCWVKRLRQMALADLGGLDGPGARQALRWAQTLVSGFSSDVSGPAARARALVNQWTREHRDTDTTPAPPLTPPTPGGTPPTPTQTPTALADSPRTSVRLPSRAKHFTWHPAQRPIHPLDLGASPESPPFTRPSTPRDARQARGSLPPFDGSDTPPAPPSPGKDSPIGRALRTAQQGGSVQPLIDALREWPATALDDEDTDSSGSADDLEAFGRLALRGVLTLCSTRDLDPALRAELLRAAHPLLGPAWTCDALLRSDWASALHEWLEPDAAAHLLLANGLPPGPLPGEHPYQARLTLRHTLIDWGLPEAAARRLPSHGRYAWAHHKLFDGTAPCVRAEGGGHALRFVSLPELDDTQVDAVLVVCKLWLQAQRPDLALALMTATRDGALTEHLDATLLRRWESLVLELKRQTAVLDHAPAVPLPEFLRKVFAPWLTVSLAINPATAQTTDVACVVDAKLAAGAKSSARQRALMNLEQWLETELQDPNGLPWPLLVKLLETVEQQLGSAMALPSTQWLKMAVMEYERSGNAEPLPALLSSLVVQQKRMAAEGHRQPLVDHALLDKVFLLAQQAGLDAVSRANLIQNALPLLPERQGPGASSHAACLLAMLAQDDLLIRGTLFDAYREMHPFANRSDLTPRLFLLAGQLDRPERLRSTSTWSAFGHLPQPGKRTAWPLWRALCRELGRRMLPRLLEVQQPTQAPQEQREFNEQILRVLHRLSEHTRQPGLSAERQAELLADLTAALPASHRRAFLEQLDAACLALIERSLAPGSGARPGPVPPWQIALRGALQALLDQVAGGSPRAPAPCSSPALDASTQFLREWFAVRLAGHLGGVPPRNPDLKELKLLRDIALYSPLRLLQTTQADPVEALIEDLFALPQERD